MQMSCPLCAGQDCQFYHQRKTRQYWQCLDCQLVFVPPAFHLSAEDEKSEYDLHQNTLFDQGYRRFLSRPMQLITQRVAKGSLGLDFGCGPCPTLAAMLMEQGYEMALYDHYYFHQPQALTMSYDFIVCTEVFEHLSAPGKIFDQLVGLLKPDGCLLIMSKRVQNRTAFAQWHYIHDPTHIVFLSEETCHYLAAQHQLSLQITGTDTLLFFKHS